jgi:hypothetical protein
VRKLGAAAGVLCLVAALTACVSTESATNDCLARPVVNIADDSAKYPLGWRIIPDGSAIDARSANWAIANDYPFSLQHSANGNRDDVCMVGGTITSLYPHDTTPWSVWHGTVAMTIERPKFQTLQARLHSVGDGVRFATGAADWTIRGAHMTRVHDDCVENDRMHSGIIDDSLFDGCYVFYSSRSDSAGLNGEDNTVTVTNSLVRLEHMPFTFNNEPGGGHGSMFKLSSGPATGRSPRLVIRNTVFRADEEPAHGTLDIVGFNHDNDPSTPSIPYLDPADCSNNTMVWLGDGPFPGDLPDCFTVTTDRQVWLDAVAGWHARRP